MGRMTFTQTGCIWVLLTLPFSVSLPLLVISFLLPTNPLFIPHLSVSVSVSVPACLSFSRKPSESSQGCPKEHGAVVGAAKVDGESELSHLLLSASNMSLRRTLRKHEGGY